MTLRENGGAAGDPVGAGHARNPVSRPFPLPAKDARVQARTAASHSAVLA